MKKFEYKRELNATIKSADLINYLNKLGSEGWEIVSYSECNNTNEREPSKYITFFAKREIK